MQAIDIVERPKISPHPPEAITTASAGKGADLHRHHILGDAAAADAVVVEHRGQKIPELVFGHFAFDFPAADLLIECVEQLLAGGRAGERGPFEERAAESALIAKTFGRAIEGDAEPVHQVDDSRTPVDHFLDRRLMVEEIAAVNRVVEMEPLGVALLPRERVDAVDAPLSANAMRPLDRREAHQIDVDAQLGQLHRGGQPGQPAADHHHPLFRHEQ